MKHVSNYVPMVQWTKSYTRVTFQNDLLAAMIVTIMLIPQSLAYALLAGLPPETGLYASIVPILLYSVLGSSRTLAVGPVAVVSLMTAATLGKVASSGSVDYASAALTLAALSGSILILMGIFRLGFLTNYLSHPVIAGFITASGLVIAVSQLKNLLGIEASGHNLVELLESLMQNIASIHWFTFAIGVFAIAFLYWIRKGLSPLLHRLGMKANLARVVTKSGPIVVVVGTTIIVWYFDLVSHGVGVVGTVPRSLPPLTLPHFTLELTQALFIPALLISIIGFVESISVAQTLAAKKRQRIEPNQELFGLGAANIGAAFTGGFPVTGGFSRTVVNFDAGAETPAAGAFTAVLLAIAAVALTPLVYYLPKATLAATIIVAVLSLVDFSILARAWSYSKSDFIAVLVTIVLTLGVGVELGVTAGVVVSILLFLYKTSRPHVAEVGLVPNTHHFRNINRHKVVTDPAIVTIRVDESLYFANAKFLEDYMYNRTVASSEIKHVVLMCSAVNEIDMSALESLETINLRLKELGIKLHLSEVKGPVMDRIERTDFLQDLSGQVFLSQHDAITSLTTSF